MPDYKHMTQFEREELAQLAEDLQRAARRHGANVRRKEAAGELCLGLFNLGRAITNFTKLDGHMSVWATFQPKLPNFEFDDFEYGEESD